MNGDAGTKPPTEPAMLTPAAGRARVAHQPETVGDYITRLVAAAPPIGPDHPAADLLIRHFKTRPDNKPAARKTA